MPIAVVITAAVLLLAGPAGRSASATDSVLDNGLIRVGVDSSLGGAIDYLAESGNPGRNYINRHDPGRLVQLSYYGSPTTAADCPAWDPWPWNPVQGGDCAGNMSGVLEVSNDGTTIYTKSQPLDWAKNNVRRNAIYETWITLEGRAVRVDTRVTNDSEDHAQLRDQEVPALYVTTDLTNLKTYDGTSPFTGGGLTNVNPPQLPGTTSFRPTEFWSAWLNTSDFGVGVFSQDVQYCTSFRAGSQGDTNDYSASTNYVAMLPRLTVPPNAVHTSAFYLILDTLTNIRSFAVSEAVYPSVAQWEFNETNNREGWALNNGTDNLGVSGGSWSFTTPGSDPQLIGPTFLLPVTNSTRVEIRMSSTNSDTSGKVFWNRLSDPIHSFAEERSQSFSVIGDGAMHTYTIDLTSHTYWAGTISQLRMDPVSTGSGGTIVVDYIRASQSAAAPSQATNPSPGHLATGIGLGASVSWTAGQYAASHNVYFGTTNPPGSTEFMGNQTATLFNPPGILVPLTTYYWRIDEVNGAGTTIGDVWSFTTGFGDFDEDGDVDLDDFGMLQRCFTETGGTIEAGCEQTDLDGDGDVDGGDFVIWQGCVGGANLPPAC